MTQEIRLQTNVLPGHRIELTAPELPEGDSVEVIVRYQNSASEPARGILDFLRSLPPGPHSYRTWEEMERAFQQERDSWGHSP